MHAGNRNAAFHKGFGNSREFRFGKELWQNDGGRIMEREFIFAGFIPEGS